MISLHVAMLEGWADLVAKGLVSGAAEAWHT